MTTKVVAAFLLIVMWSGLLLGQQSANTSSPAVVPQLVNFSGRAVDAQGKTISGIAGVTFAIYKDQYEGGPLWMETQNVTADSKGNYTAQLGAATSSGLPLELFSAGEARWLGVRVNGGEEQARVLLLSVPYALKAADAQTLGGLPASAFVLAAPPTPANNAAAIAASSTGNAPPPASSDVTTTGGIVNSIPLFSTTTNIQNSAISQTGSGSTAKIGINTASPAVALDVHGATTVRGTLTLPASGVATAIAGKNSDPQNLVASAFNSSTSAAVNQIFQWQAEPSNNNTANPSAVLSLLYGSGTTAPAETGLRIGPKGILGFAPGQTFPGTGVGTITGVTAGTALTGGGASGNVTLNLDTTQVPLLAANNVFTGSDNLFTGTVNFAGLGSFANAAFLSSTFTGNALFEPQTAADAIDAYTSGAGKTALVGIESATSGGSYGVWARTSDPTGAGVKGTNIGGTGGVGVSGKGDIGVFGTGSSYGFQTDSNVQQARTAGGWVKAMVYVDDYDVPFTIQRCFNSTLAGAAATTPPCGFAVTPGPAETGAFVNFGFRVDDRFLMAQPGTAFSNVVACVDTDPDCVSFTAGPTPSQVLVLSRNDSGNPIGIHFYLFVY